MQLHRRPLLESQVPRARDLNLAGFRQEESVSTRVRYLDIFTNINNLISGFIFKW